MFAWAVAAGVAATLTWKLVEFAIMAQALIGDHMLHCSQCKQPVLIYVSDHVAHLMAHIGQHQCGKADNVA